MDIQRLRNLTTGRLHTKIGHIYEDLGIITGKAGLMTLTLPLMARAVEPWLREHIKDKRFWNGKRDPSHTGEFSLPDPTDKDRKAMLERFKEQLNPLEGKNIVVLKRLDSKPQED